MHSRSAPISTPALTVLTPSRPGDAEPSSAADIGRDHKTLSAQVDTAVGLSDSEREHAIQRAGLAVVRHMVEWERTGCFSARGDADRARRLMELLIAGRSPQQVARMEQERGLAGA